MHPGTLLIPKGSTLIGSYNSSFKVGQSRVLVAMTRLILPDGRWISLAGTPATDAQGMSGMVADVNNHFLKMFSASFVIGATSLLLPSSQQNITVTSPTNSGTQTGGTIFAQTLQQTVQQLLQRNVNIQPTGTVQPGTPFDFMVSRDLLISPYEGFN
ncbi:type IV secretion system protein virB10 [mine drainage metagenome]|uniref:Type IV secretion system protein virB10 n=1 Tax=mine drainage metagenome TaxID=410659 RepID=A0A1J5PMS9_9ZZZZ